MNDPQTKAKVALEEIAMEAQAMVATYMVDDGEEDSAVADFIAWTRKVMAASPAHLRVIAAHEERIRRGDAKADRRIAISGQSIRELVLA